MRRALLMAVLCIHAPRLAAQALDPAAAALAEVQRNDQISEQTGSQLNQAKAVKTKYQKILEKVLRDFADKGPIGQMFASGEKNRAEKAYHYAKDKATKTEIAYMESGREYLESEQQYRQTSGGFANPEKVHFWENLLGSLGGPEAEVDPTKPLDVGQVEQQTKDFNKNLTEIMKGPMDASSAAKLMAQGQKMERYNDGVFQAASNQGFAAGKASDKPQTGERANLESSGREANSPLRLASGIDLKALERPILLAGDKNRKQVVEEQKKNAYDQGHKALRSGDAQGALKAAQFVIDKDPRSFQGHRLKAKALNALRRFKEAAAAAAVAVRLNPMDADSLKELVWAQLHNRDYQAAAQNAEKLIGLMPDSPLGYLLRAFAREKLGDKKGMLADLRKAARIDPRYAGHLAKALAGEALFNPDDPDSFSLLAPLEYAGTSRKNETMRIGALLLLLAVLVFIAAAIKPRIEAWLARRALEKNLPPISTLRTIAATNDALLGGKYRLDRIVGKGGMGRVWEAFDLSLARPVAVKQMAKGLDHKGSRVREIYLKEAATLASLNHPNIVNIFEVIDRPDGVYLIFEYVQGKTTQQLLAENRRLPWRSAKEILSSVCEGLAFAHTQGFIHRDLKPANIMITESGYVKIMDFGIARAVGRLEPVIPGADSAKANELTDHTRNVAGTPTYMSPEAQQGFIAPVIDVFSLGACLYEFLTADYAFGRGGWTPASAKAFVPASRKISGLDRRIDQVIADSLEADYRKRIQSAKDFQRRLEEI